MRRRIFHKYLISFTSFFLIPMIALSICLQVVMYKNLSKEILNYNKSILERMADDLVAINGRLMETGNRISFSAPVLLKSFDTSNQVDMINLLRKENAENNQIAKAYLIFKNEELGFSSQGVYEKTMLLSSQLRIPANEQKAFLNRLYMVEKPEYDVIHKEYNQKSGTSIHKSMIFIYPVYNFSDKVESWAILELQDSKMRLDLSTSAGEYSKGISILNQDGKRLIFKGQDISCDGILPEALTAEPQLCKVLKQPVNGQKAIIYRLGSPKLILVDWVAMPNLLGTLLESNSLLSIGVLAFLFVGCIMAVYVAYCYYKPIHQLAQYMRKEDETVTEQDELDYIKDQYDTINVMKESLSNELEKQWPLVEERLVTKLLYDGIQESADNDIIGKVFNQQIGKQDHLAALVAQKNGSRTTLPSIYKEKERSMKTALNGYEVQSTYIYEYEAIAVIMGKKDLSAKDRDLIKEELEIVYTGGGCIVSLGNIYSDVSGIHISFLEALTALKYKLLNPNKEYKLDEGNQKDGEAYSRKISMYQNECLVAISRCIDGADDKEIEKSVREVVFRLEELPGQMALMCCYDIVSQLMKEVKKKNIHMKEVQLVQLATFRTVEEFGKKLKDALLNICQDVKEKKLKDQNMLASQIRSYIEENYKNPELCLVTMADYFGYSSSYLSKFISQNLDRGFSELVSEKRVSFTKKCLIETNKPIAQIASEAGYVNLSNFTRRFKSEENMTPGQYRSLYKEASGK